MLGLKCRPVGFYAHAYNYDATTYNYEVLEYCQQRIEIKIKM